MRQALDGAPTRRVHQVVQGLISALLVVFALGLVTIVALIRIDHLQLEPALSGSMRPVFQPGDLVVARPTSTATLHVGAIIAFYPPGQRSGAAYMHRIVGLTSTPAGPKIITKGDANRDTDPFGPVTLTSPITYRLVDVVPKLGFVSVWAHNLAASKRALILVGSGLLLLVVAASSLRRETRRSDGRNDAAVDLEGKATS